VGVDTLINIELKITDILITITDPHKGYR